MVHNLPRNLKGNKGEPQNTPTTVREEDQRLGEEDLAILGEISCHK